MKKIISIFLILILALVSGCDKLNALKDVPPVDNQVIQSGDGQKNQRDDSPPANQAFHLTGTKAAHIFCRIVVSLFVLYIGYKVYRHYYTIKEAFEEPKFENLPAEFSQDVMSLFNVEEWNFLSRFEAGRTPDKVYRFLRFF